jgi:hypothetical protein
VSKNHSTHRVQQLRSRQGLGSKRSECNCRDGSAIFVESEHPPNGECPGKCPARPLAFISGNHGQKTSWDSAPAASSGVTLVPPRRCTSGPARSTAKEKGVAQPGLEWTLSTRAERLLWIKRWFGS